MFFKFLCSSFLLSYPFQAQAHIDCDKIFEGLTSRTLVAPHEPPATDQERGWKETDPHIVFGPTVGFIGENYLKNPRFKNNPSMILEKCFKAMFTELKEKSKTGVKLEPENVEQLNRSLISRLRNDFGYPFIPY